MDFGLPKALSLTGRSLFYPRRSPLRDRYCPVAKIKRYAREKHSRLQKIKIHEN
ncbi:MAG: hypothetical protein F6J93_09190 [Oscillatoria sp. SIO1A7]|nr:hypothetical protein [Oscillatoria sp. SIO1A7]